MVNSVEFDIDLIRRYEGSGPRYTSYPTAMEFSPGVQAQDYINWVRESNATGRPLSLYVHIPFCAHVCFFCACNKIITGNRNKAQPYLDHLYHEIELQSALVDSARTVEQLHWGGGTPTFLSEQQMAELMGRLRRHFNLRDDDRGEYSIEIDPREVRDGTLPVLREIGFNRVSLGVQDFDPGVQKAVHRLQSAEQTLGAMREARELGFRSINIDLMYGLPLQTTESFAQTLDAVIEVRPDRLSVFNYAHLPERFKPQRRINVEELPSADEKLAILSLTIEKLTAAGYRYVGMDHFAVAEDELVLAQQNGTLHRNFQGYSTHSDSDLVAMGVSAISSMPGGFAQNTPVLDDYYSELDASRLPIVRGVAINDDDRLRGEVIQQLICNNTLDKAQIANQFGVDFDRYFSGELAQLSEMEADGLVQLDAGRVDISARGRLLIRNICKIFDRYRVPTEEKFSKMI